ncbi:hypothetical protein WA026_005232 [Henosepilachna vigintioctopunctata]|uniref:Uncharacterized protein n=1 Tax=Henosepilachna vigintioctopunctata TaxID=420089 RepID=A0AAW1UTC1_9CUCU
MSPQIWHSSSLGSFKEVNVLSELMSSKPKKHDLYPYIFIGFQERFTRNVPQVLPYQACDDHGAAINREESTNLYKFLSIVIVQKNSTPQLVDITIEIGVETTTTSKWLIDILLDHGAAINREESTNIYKFPSIVIVQKI